ncbi:unnamed protein product [Nippostrongylus brasiliensis]|uniref:Transcriptional regulator n=1 Tax=Nippostrongylus brasiliensis TaxID=27835 RepID=A0A0N4YQV9_NIPBR|nr:unnamed protein product [Nippostrongylus brasiliensis]
MYVHRSSSSVRYQAAWSLPDVRLGAIVPGTAGAEPLSLTFSRHGGRVSAGSLAAAVCISPRFVFRKGD